MIWTDKEVWLADWAAAKRRRDAATTPEERAKAQEDVDLYARLVKQEMEMEELDD